MINISEVIKQHYVPRFYLRKFSLININDSKNDKKNKLIVFDKLHNKQYLSNVYNSACINHFYDLDNINNKKFKQIFENEFSLIEKDFSNLLDKFINICNHKENYFSSLIINKEEREEFSYYLVIQLLRTKKFRDLQKSIHQNSLNNSIRFYKLYKKNYLNDECNLNPGDLVVNEKKFHLNTLTNDELINKLIYFLSNSYWTFLHNNTNLPFITSDNPLCRIPTITNSANLELSPFISELSEFYFPISPKLAVCIYRDNSIFCKIQGKKLINRLMPLNNINFVNDINKYQFIMSHEKVFFHPNNKDLIEKYCKSNITSKVNSLF